MSTSQQASSVRRTLSRKGTVGAIALVVLLAGYSTADAYDLVPGLLTTKPAIEVQDVPQPVSTATGEPAAFPLSTDAPVPANVQAELDPIFEDEGITSPIAAEVRDGSTGDVLYQRDASAAKTPASVTKVITAAAALGAVGQETTFKTRTVFDDSSARLFLVGGGDVLLTGGQSNPTATNGHAGLATLAELTAQELKQAGHTEVSVAADLSRYSNDTFNPGWDKKDIGNGYITNIVPLMTNSGYTTTKDFSPREPAPAQKALDEFSQALAKHGITATTEEKPQDAPEAAREIGVVESAPVGSVVRYMLLHSDNVVAETLGREIALARGVEANTSNSAEQTIAQLADMGIDTGSIRLEDTSGLNYDNRISPHDLTGIVQATITRPELSSLISNMPVSGLSGTLASRFTSDDTTAGAGLIQAKTGTLQTVTSLSGALVTTEGRVLVFSIMADGLEPGTVGPARNAVDKAVTALAKCGCT